MPKKPEVIAFKNEGYGTRCHICLDTEMRDWISECLEKTVEVGHPKPQGVIVHRELARAFGEERVPASDNTTRRHLNLHEPTWMNWPGHET